MARCGGGQWPVRQYQVVEVLSVASCGGAVSGPLWISQYQVVEVLSVASCGGAVSGVG